MDLSLAALIEEIKRAQHATTCLTSTAQVRSCRAILWHACFLASALKQPGIARFIEALATWLTTFDETALSDVANQALLARAIDSLRSVVEEAHADKAAPILRLFPDYRAIQAARGEVLARPTDLLLATNTARQLKDDATDLSSPAHITQALKQARAAFQRGIFVALSETQQPTGASQMHAAMQGVETIAFRALNAIEAYFWAFCTCFTEALTKSAPDDTLAAIKQFAPRIDRQIRRILQSSDTADVVLLHAIQTWLIAQSEECRIKASTALPSASLTEAGTKTATQTIRFAPSLQRIFAVEAITYLDTMTALLNQAEDVSTAQALQDEMHSVQQAVYSLNQQKISAQFAVLEENFAAYKHASAVEKPLFLHALGRAIDNLRPLFAALDAPTESP